MGKPVQLIQDVKAKDFVTSGKLQPDSYSMTRLYNHIKDIPSNVTVRLDFTGVQLGDITNDDLFKELLISQEFSNVFMRFNNEPKLTTICEMLLELANVKSRKVLNVTPESKVLSGVDLLFRSTKQTQRVTDLLLSKAVEENNLDQSITVHYYRWKGNYILTSANSPTSIAGLYYAIKETLERLGWRKALVDFDDLEVMGARGESTGDMLHNMCTLLERDGYHTKLLFNDEKSQRQWNLSVGMAEMQEDKTELQKKIDMDLKPGMVGVFTEYVPNENKPDRLGRVGEGKVATRQPAIYLGHEGNIYKFRQFIGSKFMRRTDWYRKIWEEAQYLAELGETVTEENVFDLRYKDIEIPFEKLGICRYCYGTHYHFSLPVQTSAEESIPTVVYRRSTERFEKVKILLPQFIAEVLRENGIEHDREQLETCILLSEANMEKANIKIEDLTDLDFTKLSE